MPNISLIWETKMTNVITSVVGALRWVITVGLCTFALSSLIIVVLNSPDYVFL